MMTQTVYTEDLEHIADDIVAQATAGSNIANEKYGHLRACVMESQRQHSARLVDMVRDQLASNKSHDDIKSYFNHMDDYLTQCYRQRNIQLTEPSENTTADSPTRDAHVTVLHVLSGVLNKNLRLQGTTVLDHLVEDEVMSEAGRESILARPTKRERNAAFLTFCNRLTQHRFQSNVLPALKQSNDNVNSQLAKDIEYELAIPIADRRRAWLCAFCKIQEQVNLRQLADRLYENLAILDPLFHDLSSLNHSNEWKWDVLMRKVKKMEFLNALEGRYPDLYTDLQLTPLTKMICTCDEYYTQSEENGNAIADVESTEMDILSDSFQENVILMKGVTNINLIYNGHKRTFLTQPGEPTIVAITYHVSRID